METEAETENGEEIISFKYCRVWDAWSATCPMKMKSQRYC